MTAVKSRFVAIRKAAVAWQLILPDPPPLLSREVGVDGKAGEPFELPRIVEEATCLLLPRRARK